jgi:ABC-type lipoprotein release transport system permease subunit
LYAIVLVGFACAAMAIAGVGLFGVLAGMSVVACIVPARRAARIDPLQVMR